MSSIFQADILGRYVIQPKCNTHDNPVHFKLIKLARKQDSKWDIVSIIFCAMLSNGR